MTELKAYLVSIDTPIRDYFDGQVDTMRVLHKAGYKILYGADSNHSETVPCAHWWSGSARLLLPDGPAIGVHTWLIRTDSECMLVLKLCGSVRDIREHFI